MSRRGVIKDIIITPVAFHDMPLLNSVGVHEPFALRSIIEVITEDTYGLGESYGDSTHLDRLKAASEQIKGLSVYNTNGIYQKCTASLEGNATSGGDGMAGMVTTASVADKVFSPFEVACLDIQGKLAGVPVSDLLGGLVRDQVQYSAYLFYKWAGHPGEADDEYGAALDAPGLVRQAQKIIDEYGFKAIKLKGGVYPPAQEVEAIKALHAAFPKVPLRLDPNAAWTVETSKWVAAELKGIVEYLEDPAPEIDGMAAITRLSAELPEESFATYGGQSDFLIGGLAAGSAGTIAGFANVFPRTIVHIYNLYKEGKFQEAMMLHKKAALAEQPCKAGIAAVKYAAALNTAKAAGIEGAVEKLRPRQPYVEPSAAAKKAIEEQTAELAKVEATLRGEAKAELTNGSTNGA
ncbi:hypothetical protein BN1723_008638 [Verticillium longisporum]|uniref:glucarate dehydratase n=1 Tax=Verticillium longisporum TaxID=100787 RepID=A0A0G4KHB4_VERLO|nr:hypothetical protein BN1723_008638 [Verticillium longisporum]